MRPTWICGERRITSSLRRTRNLAEIIWCRSRDHAASKITLFCGSLSTWTYPTISCASWFAISNMYFLLGLSIWGHIPPMSRRFGQHPVLDPSSHSVSIEDVALATATSSLQEGSGAHRVATACVDQAYLITIDRVGLTVTREGSFNARKTSLTT